MSEEPKKFEWKIERKKIPKAEKKGVRISEYDDLVEAISKEPEGTTGEIEFSGKKITAVYSSVISRKEKVAKTTPFTIMVREPVYEETTTAKGETTKKLKDGRLFFQRLSPEEYAEKKAERERKKK